MIVVLGAGIAGLSAAWHLGHERCHVIEKQAVIGGHARSVVREGFTSDHGPHVSFTRNEYVRQVFAANTGGRFEEFDIRVANFYRGNLIEHPAQVHLWQLPQPLRDTCSAEIRAAALRRADGAPQPAPLNYDEWLRCCFGDAFTDALPAAYTRKYWTVSPSQLSCDWLGPRMYTPTPAEVDAALTPGSRNTGYYIQSGRYPSHGGYESFFRAFAAGANVTLAAEVQSIDLRSREIVVGDFLRVPYTRLVSTLPLPEFISKCRDVPDEVTAAARALDCSSLLLVDVTAPRRSSFSHKWLYVYDEDKLSTRIHLVENLAPSNAPPGMTGVQVEVYFSRHRPAQTSPDAIAARVVEELVEFGLIDRDDVAAGRVGSSWRWCGYANVMFTHARRASLDVIFAFLAKHGLERESDDLEATTDWSNPPPAPSGALVMAGRFAQWKYFWTDDCVLRGRQLAGRDGPLERRT